MMKKLITLTIMITTLLFAKGMHQGEVIETMNSGGYTYMKISEGGKSYWVASNQINIKKGANILFAQEMALQKFHSKTLNRTFDQILFISEIQDAKAAKQIPKNTATSSYKTEETLSVKETFQNAKSLAGKTVQIRGKVVKVSQAIMNKNWIHIQDGTGDKTTNDIIFTSEKESARVGDIVLAKGILAIDKDFGHGYVYPLIIEKSSFTK